MHTTPDKPPTYQGNREINVGPTEFQSQVEKPVVTSQHPQVLAHQTHHHTEWKKVQYAPAASIYELKTRQIRLQEPQRAASPSSVRRWLVQSRKGDSCARLVCPRDQISARLASCQIRENLYCFGAEFKTHHRITLHGTAKTNMTSYKVHSAKKLAIIANLSLQTCPRDPLNMIYHIWII